MRYAKYAALLLALILCLGLLTACGDKQPETETTAGLTLPVPEQPEGSGTAPESGANEGADETRAATEGGPTETAVPADRDQTEPAPAESGENRTETRQSPAESRPAPSENSPAESRPDSTQTAPSYHYDDTEEDVKYDYSDDTDEDLG